MLSFLSSILQPKPKSVLGIDISSTSVKLLELSHHNGHYCVEGYGVVPLLPGIVIEKSIKDTKALGETIQKALKQAKSNLTLAAVAVPDSSVIMHTISVTDDLQPDELEAHVMMEAPKYIPYPLEEVSYDFDLLPKPQNAKKKNQRDVLLVACRSDNVNDRVEALMHAGLKACVVDVESYAIERALHLFVDQLPNKGINEAVAVVDMGSVSTAFSVIYNLTTVFAREEVFGGEQLTHAIQEKYGLTYEQAGRAKKQGGLPEDYETAVLQPFLESAVIQIRRALQFFFSASQHTQICHILLAGGSVGLPGFVEVVESQIGIPTSIVNPFQSMKITEKVDLNRLMRDASALMACCGLAMRGNDHDKH